MPSKQLNHCGTLSINRRAYVLIQQQLNDEDAKTQMLLDRAVVFFCNIQRPTNILFGK